MRCLPPSTLDVNAPCDHTRMARARRGTCGAIVCRRPHPPTNTRTHTRAPCRRIAHPALPCTRNWGCWRRGHPRCASTDGAAPSPAAAAGQRRRRPRLPPRLLESCCCPPDGTIFSIAPCLIQMLTFMLFPSDTIKKLPSTSFLHGLSRLIAYRF